MWDLLTQAVQTSGVLAWMDIYFAMTHFWEATYVKEYPKVSPTISKKNAPLVAAWEKGIHSVTLRA